MTFLDDLNPPQREAVLQVEGPLLILAGAGSGKTRVITYRIAHLVGGGYAAPGEVLAVTFTNKAAEEMRARVEALLASTDSPPWLSTFHTFCARVLRREAPAIGLPRDFLIYDTADQLAVVKRALGEVGVDEKILPPRVALARISEARNRMLTPRELGEAAQGYRDEQLARVFERYEAALAAANALDFDDLLLRVVQLVETVEPVRARYAARFRHILVDEYQDTNRPQYLIVRRLAAAHRNLCVVGDPDQSIYRWRGADVRNILDFETDFPEARVVKLEQNYRSTQVILDAASAVIRQNLSRHDKRLWTDRAGGEPVGCVRAADELEEADFITGTARAATGTGPQVAVLYRTNAQSRVIEDALTRERIPYKVVGGIRFYERKEIKDALAYLRLLINPHDDVSVRRVINVPARGIGKVLLESLERVELPAEETPLLHDPGAPARPASLWTRLRHALDRRLFAPRSLAALGVFRDVITGFAAAIREQPVSAIVGMAIEQSGYLAALRDEGTEEATGRIDNLLELVSAAREYETRDAEASLAGFVDRLSLLSEADEESGAADARVWLMTLHAAKGLEFPTVVMAGMEEDIFPHARAKDQPQDIEEERRLCYVGMTRARSRLFLTSAARRRVYGEYRATTPSRFLDEVPRALVERVGSGTEPESHRWTGPARSGSYGRGRGFDRVREEPARVYAYEDEDQSARAEIGMRVRHAEFGVGTVLRVEGYRDDVKLTVRFSSVGVKKLIGRYANLTRA